MPDININVVAIIPAYNESKRIAETITETLKYVASVIVIDDGSADGTQEIAIASGAKVIRHTFNMGKGAALKTGFKECMRLNPDIVITIDADGQHDPKDIPRLIEPLEKKAADAVIGSRYAGSSSSIPAYRQAGLSIIGLLDKYVAKSIVSDSQSGFRAFSKEALPIVSSFNSTGFGVESEQIRLIEQYGLRVAEVPITIKYQGLENTSKKHPVLHGMEIISLILKIIIEKRPLLTFGGSGFALLIISAIMTINLIKIFNDTRYFSIPLSIVTLGFSLLGFMLVIAAIILYSNNKLNKKLNSLRRDILSH
jgi:glycosyltransferase involved in cell wall biosynthesis